MKRLTLAALALILATGTAATAQTGAPAIPGDDPVTPPVIIVTGTPGAPAIGGDSPAPEPQPEPEPTGTPGAPAN
jgi:hypothetical protein